MIVKVLRHYIVDGFMSELHECDTFRYIAPEEGNSSSKGPNQKELKYKVSLSKKSDITELEVFAGDTIYVMENGRTVDTFYVPTPAQGSN